MKTICYLNLFLYILFSNSVCGQQYYTSQKEEIKSQIEQLRIQAKYEIDSIQKETEFKLLSIKSEGEVALAELKINSEAELFTLQQEADREFELLKHDIEASLFDGALRRKYFDDRYLAIECDYNLQIAQFENTYNTSINLLNEKYTKQIALTEAEGQFKIEEIAKRYEKEIAHLELTLKD